MALRSKYRSTVRIFDALVGEQPSCESWSYVTCSRFDVAHEANLVGDQLKPYKEMSIVDLSIFTGGDTDDGHILIHRVTYSAVESGQDAVAAYLTKKSFDPLWKQSTEIWAPVYDDAESAAEEISRLQDQWHYLLLGKPVSHLADMQLHQPELVDAVADIATELPLPGDTLLKRAKRACQFTGIIGGALSGQPLLVNACLKSLVHDLLADKVREVIGHTLRDTLGLQQRQDPPRKGSLNEHESCLELSEPEILARFKGDQFKSVKESPINRFERDRLETG